MSNISDVVIFLNKVPLFRGLKNRQLEKIAKQFTERDYAAGTPIVIQGHGGEGIFIIVSGKVDVIREQIDGAKTLLNQMGPGDFLGELALLDNGLRTATCIATESAHCLVMSHWNFMALLKEDADMAVTVLQEVVRRFRMALESL